MSSGHPTIGESTESTYMSREGTLCDWLRVTVFEAVDGLIAGIAGQELFLSTPFTKTRSGLASRNLLSFPGPQDDSGYIPIVPSSE